MDDAPLNLPPNWLAVELASPDLDPATWPDGIRQSFEALMRQVEARARKDPTDV